jgi:transposase InsO family protein
MAKKRKAKVSQGASIARRREVDRRRREQARPEAKRQRRDQSQYRFRIKVVRRYRQEKAQRSEQAAIAIVMAEYGSGVYQLSANTIRRWHRLVGEANDYSALYPHSTRPKTMHDALSLPVVSLIYILRRWKGWGGHRIAAELKRRGLAQVSGKTVYRVFERLGLPVKRYALKARSVGIAYRRYQCSRPNVQWHLDFTEFKLADGRKLYLCLIIDDYSRYILCAAIGTATSSAWVVELLKKAITQYGKPQQVVTDNGKEFVSRWEEGLTELGRFLQEQAIVHYTIAPYYPQGNGKAEAAIKTLKRELLKTRLWSSRGEVESALTRFLRYYNNYRAHSSLGWHTPAEFFTGRAIRVQGLAEIPGLETIAQNPDFGTAWADPPIVIEPSTLAKRFALVLS